jgi:cytochrome c biogenesis protein
LSILIILAGALLGTLFGLEAFVFLPEGRATSDIFLQKNRQSIPLGFTVQCNRFEKIFYPNGMIRKYQADLQVFDQELDTPYQKSIIVNDPLTYKGFTFYLADSAPLEEFYVQIRNLTASREQAFRVPAKRDIPWQEGNVILHIAELEHDQEGTVLRAKIRFTTNTEGEPSELWINNKGTVTIRHSGMDYTLTFRQFYETLLLVNRDPGVQVVYLGCILMLFGLATSFFLSHRRLWVKIEPRGNQKAALLVSGTSNKHKLAFEQQFAEMIYTIDAAAEVAPLK